MNDLTNSILKKIRGVPFGWLRALLITAIIFTGVTSVFLPLFLIVMDRNNREQENLSARNDYQRVVDEIYGTINFIDRILSDYTLWDDTYAFMQGENPGYPEANLYDEGLKNLGLNMVVALDVTGKVYYQKGFSLQLAQPEEIPFSIDDFVKNNPVLSNVARTDFHTSGLIRMADRVILFSAYPVHDSQGIKKPNGALIFGRYLDRDELGRISSQSRVSGQIEFLDDKDLPQNFQKALGEVKSGSQLYIDPVDNEKIAIYGLLNDFQGRPIAVLRVESSRETYQQAQKSSISLVATFLVLCFSFSTILMYALDRYLHSREARREALDRYRTAVMHASDAIMVVDDDLRILDANPACEKLLGFSLKDTPYVVLDYVVAPISSEAASMTQAIRSHKNLPSGEQSYRRNDGSYVTIEFSASQIVMSGETVTCLFIRDITQRKDVERALFESRERYELAVQGANDGIWDWDLYHNKVYFSDRWKAMMGCESAEIGDTIDEWLDRIHPDDLLRVQTEISSHLHKRSPQFECEYRIRHKDGNYYWMQARGLARWDADNNACRLAGSQTDINARKLAEERLRFDALHDPLTGLPNRSLLLDRLNHANARAKRAGRDFALLFIDFDRFKMINDTYGHTKGDQFLIQMGERFQSCLRVEDTLARLSGDEFIVLLEEIHSVDDVAIVAKRLKAKLKMPVTLDNTVIFPSASIGVVVPDREYANAEEIIRDADIAMYYAKQNSETDYVLFDPSMYDQTAHFMAMESELRQAIEKREFFLVYQPIYSFADNQINGFEALIRWQHPLRGILSPAEFISVAEETGLIIPIGRWVMMEACCQLQRWQKLFPFHQPLSISVNLSSLQLCHSSLIDDVDQVLRESGCPAECLRLEITEGAVIKDIQYARKVLQQIKEKGVRVDIDDFGTGYSSLSYLQSLPVDAIKIDRSFINGILNEENGRQIVQAIITLALNMGFYNIAEGVETVEQLEILKEMDCAYVQGYLLSKPVEPAAVEKLLKTNFSTVIPIPSNSIVV